MENGLPRTYGARNDSNKNIHGRHTPHSGVRIVRTLPAKPV